MQEKSRLENCESSSLGGLLNKHLSYNHSQWSAQPHICTQNLQWQTHAQAQKNSQNLFGHIQY